MHIIRDDYTGMAWDWIPYITERNYKGFGLNKLRACASLGNEKRQQQKKRKKKRRRRNSRRRRSFASVVSEYPPAIDAVSI